jgi:DNA polymerase III subunit delta
VGGSRYDPTTLAESNDEASPAARGSARVGSRGPTVPVALFWGEDEFMLREAARAFLDDFGAHAVDVEAAEWRGGETSDLSTPSLWGERRALLVQGAHALPDHGVRELQAYLSAPAPDAALVVTAAPRAGKPPKWSEAVTAGGGTVRQVTAPRRQDLSRWLGERAAARRLAVTPAGFNALTSILGEDPATLDQALEQLASAFGGGQSPEPVGPAQVRAQFEGLGEQRVWDLCDRAFAGRLGEALVTLRGMLDEREDALVILGGIASRVRDLIKVRALPERLPQAEAAKRAGLRFDWQVRRYREQAGRFTPESLAALHARVVEADRALKGGVPGSVLLPTLVAAMSGQPDAALDVEIRSSR